MPKKLELSIPEPCHEDWDAMTPADKGRFCGSCQKQVMDFTNMSDSQLVAFFKKKSTGSVCGRFMPEQLDNAMDIPKKRIPWVRYFFQFTLPLFLASMKANAQKGKVAVKQVATKTDTNCKRPDISEVIMGGMQAMIVTHPTIRIPDVEINGSVIGSDNKPVPYASIIIKGTTKGVQADSNGLFRIPYAPPAGEDDVTISVSSVGYQSRDIVIRAKEGLAGVRVKLKVHELNEVVVTGYGTTIRGMVTGAIVTIRKCTKETVKPDVLVATTTVYPNPLPSGSPVNVKCEKMEEDYYTFQLMTTGGQQVFTKEIWIDKEATLFNLELPRVTPGMYFIVMTSRQHKKRYSEKIVIQ